MIVVDSSVWINHFRGARSATADILAAEESDVVIVGDIVVLEVLRGARSELVAATLLAGFSDHGIKPLMSPELAVVAASNYRRLRALGITINKVPDLVIASFCIANGYRLLHDDRDYEHFARHLGLDVVH